jgi:DNA invertase Pin-like site-specific DNA recombinase
MTTTAISAGYVRVSSVQQRDDSDSPASQRQRLKAAGCTQIYEDLAVSGFKLSQRRRAAGYQQLLDGIRSGRIAKVLAVRLDRLARRDQIVFELVELCQKHGVEFATLATGPVSIETAAGWLQLKVNSMFGEHYSRVLSESVRAGYQGLHQAGIPARSSQSLPFYLQRIPGTRHGVEPSRHWHHARHAVNQVLARVWSTSEAGLYLNEHCGIRGEGSAIRRWMSAPAMAGHLARHPKGQQPVIILRDVWPAMVTEAERQQLLYVLQVGTGRRFNRNRPPKLLTGICRCSLCDNSMNYEQVQMRGKTYQYLRCRRAGCNRRGVVAGPIWDEITRRLDAHIHDLVQRRTLAAGVVSEPAEVSIWRRELAAREALPEDLRQQADEMRITELRSLIISAEAMPEVVEDWWPDGLAAGSIQFWSQRPQAEINADLRRIIRAVVVDPGSGAVVKTVWRA